MQKWLAVTCVLAVSASVHAQTSGRVASNSNSPQPLPQSRTHCVIVHQVGAVRGLSDSELKTTLHLREFPCAWSDEEGLQDWLAHRYDWERSVLGRR